MLNVDNINLHYGAAQALRGVSLTAEMGKITCVLGRNGVGKSSLLRAVTGQHAISAGTISFEGAALDGLAQELVRLRFGGQSLDSAAIRRHLAHSGHDALMHEVEKAAAKSGAPFLAANAPLAEARVRWSQAFDASTRVAALEDALSQARGVPGQDEAFRRLKAERDALRRAIKAGTIWEDSAGA